MEKWWNDTDSGKPKYSERNFFQLHSVYQNVTYTEWGLNPGLRGKRMVTA
jgi:hypothetical protein